MPEGHTLRRLADSLQTAFAGRPVRTSSPQGRFAESAALLDGSRVLAADSLGKHLFVDFEDDRLLHVHLGLYGKFHVARRLPDPPVGQVRLRMVTADDGDPAYGDLRGATACELFTPEQHRALLERLGPDPLRVDAEPLRAWERIRRSRAPIGGLLMDQSVVAGVGNVYRAEILFRHGLHPLRPGLALRRAQFLALWADLVVLMQAGVRTGRIDTVRPEHVDRLGDGVRRHSYVYKRDGEPCLVCGSIVRTEELAARNSFWCPRCQPAYRGRAA